MSNEDLYYDLLHAYSLGCLDQKDLDILNEYLDSGGEFFWQELGEYQNLAALLPSILIIEKPDIELKDKVARKLYRIRNEKRTKVPEEKPNVVISEEKKDAPVQNEEKLSNLFSRTRVLIREKESGLNVTEKQPDTEAHEELPDQVQDKEFEPVITKERIPGLEEIHNEDIIDIQSPDMSSINTVPDANTEIDAGGITESSYTPPKEEPEKRTYHLHGIEEKEKKKKSYGGIVLTIILFLIAAAAIAYMYTKFSSDVNNYKSGLQKLDNQIKGLSSQLAGQQEMQKILLSKDVKIVNLIGTNLSSSSFGKFIINPDESKGYLQLNSMPQIPSGDAFQLWTIMNKKFVSIAVIMPVNGTDFYHISLPVLNTREKLTFLVSQEPSTGSAKPSKNIFLTGTLQ